MYNILLHLEQASTKDSETKVKEFSTMDQETVVASVSHAMFKRNKQILLATALV